MCHILYVTLLLYAVLNSAQKHLLTCLFKKKQTLSYMFLIRHMGGYENKLGGIFAAQSSVFLVRWVTLLFLEACGGVMQQNTFSGNTEHGRSTV